MPNSPAIPGRHVSASRPLPPTRRKPMRVLPPPRPPSPARNSRSRFSWPSARRQRQSSSRPRLPSNRPRLPLEQARVDLDKTVVKASIDGATLKVDIRLGEYAQAGVLSDPADDDGVG